MFDCTQAFSVCSTQAANFGQLLSGLTLVVATVTAWIAFRQIAESREAQRESNARTKWNEYLRVCLNQHELARGAPGIDQGEPCFTEQYEWFVAFMLDACEAVYLHVPESNGEWTRTAQEQIGFHKEYLSSPLFEAYLSKYDQKFQSLIRETCRREFEVERSALLGSK